MTNLKSTELFTQSGIEVSTDDPTALDYPADSWLLWDSVSSALEPYRRKGWDGSDAEPIAVDATRQAQSFVEALPMGTQPPQVTAGYDGSVGLSWCARNMKMFAHFPPSGLMDFSFSLDRFPWAFSKQASAFDPGFIEDIRPTFGYIVRSVLLASITITTFTFLVSNMPKERKAKTALKVAPKALPR
jgi:hypothetical protein